MTRCRSSGHFWSLETNPSPPFFFYIFLHFHSNHLKVTVSLYKMEDYSKNDCCGKFFKESLRAIFFLKSMHKRTWLRKPAE